MFKVIANRLEQGHKTSRYPQEARSIGSEELAELFGRGRARVVAPEASPLDRAIGAMAGRDEPAA